MKKVLLVLIDGMRRDYITHDDSPFLYSKLNAGLLVDDLIKESVFCERSEIYTGQNSSVTGNFAAFTYDPGNSPYSAMSRYTRLWRISDYLGFDLPKKVNGSLGSFSYKGHKKIRRYFQDNVFRENGFSMNDIPSKFLGLFRLTEDHLSYDDSNSFNCPTLFDSLRNSNLRWCNQFDDLRVSRLKLNRDERLKKVINAFDAPFSLYLFADSEIDAIGHVYGTSRNARKKCVSNVDSIMKQLHDEFLVANPDGVIIFFSPHGMMDVSRTFNPEESLRKFIKANKFDVPRDAVYFIDSTMVRIWGPQSAKFKELLQSAHWSAFGSFVTPQICSKYNIHPMDELIWWAHPGVCNFPDFFRSFRPPKGMHGYRMDIREMNGFAIVLGSNIPATVIETEKLRNIKPTIERLLGIPQSEELLRRAWV